MWPHLGHSTFILGRVLIFWSSLPMTMMFSFSGLTGWMLLSGFLVSYSQPGQLSTIDLAFLTGTSLDPHFGQNLNFRRSATESLTVSIKTFRGSRGYQQNQIISLGHVSG